MSSSFGGLREPISVRELISRYYAPLLDKHQLELRPYLLGWLKKQMEERLDWCEYAMSYAKDLSDKEEIKAVHEDYLKYRKDPDNKGTVKQRYG